jgi:uncharacterized protein (TIGR02284 family)
MTSTTTATLNSLVRGELSAVETYEQALGKLEGTKGGPDLRRIREEHRHAADVLQEEVRRRGGQADQSSGAWGLFARAVEGTAKLFGNDATLKALKEGEEHGIKKYQNALQSEDLPAETQMLIDSALLPQAREHVPILDRLLSGLVERITPQEAKKHLEADPSSMLVCAYDSLDKFRQHHLEGAMSLEAFRSQAEAIARNREIIFYCA